MKPSRSTILAFVVLAQLGGGLSGGFPATSSPSSPTGSFIPPMIPAPPPGTVSGPAPTPSVTGGHVWVPSRVVPLPGEAGGLVVPGHWERRISDRETYMPPLTATTPDGRIFTLPGGVVRAPEERQSP